jgi:hypothetical protein
MYSDTYLNQFADDMVDPIYEPVITNTDPRINDGCYFGGGNAAGEADCVPLISTTTVGQIAEVNDRLKTESVAEQVAGLRRERADRATLQDGSSVRIGQVVMFVENQYKWVADDQLAMLGMFNSAELLDEADEEETLFDRLVALANSFVGGVFSIFELRADRVEVAEELCVDGVCLDADDLRRLLEQPAESGASNTPPPNEPEPDNNGDSVADDVPPEEPDTPVDTPVDDTGTSTAGTSTDPGTDTPAPPPDDTETAPSTDTGEETDPEPDTSETDDDPAGDQLTTPEPPPTEPESDPDPEEEPETNQPTEPEASGVNPVSPTPPAPPTPTTE